MHFDFAKSDLEKEVSNQTSQTFQGKNASRVLDSKFYFKLSFLENQ